MELVIGLVLVAGLAYVVYTSLNKEKADGSHPLDSVTPTAPVIVETAPVVIEQVPVETAPAKAKKSPAKKAPAKKIGRAHV